MLSLKAKQQVKAKNQSTMQKQHKSILYAK